jgi:hypothetical protein
MAQALRTPAQVPTDSIVRPLGLFRATFASTDLDATRRFCEELMGLECVRHRSDGLLIRGSGFGSGAERKDEPYWVLEVRKVAKIDHPQEMLNHWGVFVTTEAAVDRAYEVALANQEQYKLRRVQKPRMQHGSYSFYMTDADSNWWEVEYRSPDYVYTAIRQLGDQC